VRNLAAFACKRIRKLLAFLMPESATGFRRAHDAIKAQVPQAI